MEHAKTEGFVFLTKWNYGYSNTVAFCVLVWGFHVQQAKTSVTYWCDKEEVILTRKLETHSSEFFDGDIEASLGLRGFSKKFS